MKSLIGMFVCRGRKKHIVTDFFFSLLLVSVKDYFNFYEMKKFPFQ